MKLNVREMRLDEVGLIVDYFHQSTPEHLEMLGVDPTRLRPPAQWLEYYSEEYVKPIEKRQTLLVVWEQDGAPIGFSSTDKIVYGKEAYMHLHIVRPEHRKVGVGATCVQGSARIYFERLWLEYLYCEPNAFNVAPNRTLQTAGFKYVKTHKTVPGPLNYHQAVNRWMMKKQPE